MPIKLQVQQPPLMLLLTPLRWRKLPPLPQKPIRIPAFPVATERSNHWFNQQTNANSLWYTNLNCAADSAIPLYPFFPIQYNSVLSL